MVADVPVGVFLSGGTDSSIVTALMQAQSRHPVRTFTIGFERSHHDEAHLAREVAGHLHTAHTELYVSGADALAVVPTLPAMFDEPFADASQVPTALVARLARTEVTVALSGDGGDELFFGYKRYDRALRNWRWQRRVPAPLRRALARSARQHGEGVADGRICRAGRGDGRAWHRRCLSPAYRPLA
jgi:asparagine synthase (glutamine-hydrolysing)